MTTQADSFRASLHHTEIEKAKLEQADKTREYLRPVLSATRFSQGTL